MGHYLLDTHAAIWFFEDNPLLSKTANKIISDPSNIKYLSVASAWEVAIKISVGKFKFNDGAEGFLRLAEKNGFIIGSIKSKHLSTYEKLPLFHRDPFDRLLIATAIAENMTLITDDSNIALYDVSHIW